MRTNNLAQKDPVRPANQPEKRPGVHKEPLLVMMGCPQPIVPRKDPVCSTHRPEKRPGVHKEPLLAMMGCPQPIVPRKTRCAQPAVRRKTRCAQGTVPSHNGLPAPYCAEKRPGVRYHRKLRKTRCPQKAVLRQNSYRHKQTCSLIR